jgi:hypothetical protein
MGLGDRIEQALTLVGLTKERVERWIGPECGCTERQERLNALGAWAGRVLRGKVDHALLYLKGIMGEL